MPVPTVCGVCVCVCVDHRLRVERDNRDDEKRDREPSQEWGMQSPPETEHADEAVHSRATRERDCPTPDPSIQSRPAPTASQSSPQVEPQTSVAQVSHPGPVLTPAWLVSDRPNHDHRCVCRTRGPRVPNSSLSLVKTHSRRMSEIEGERGRGRGRERERERDKERKRVRHRDK